MKRARIIPTNEPIPLNWKKVYVSFSFRINSYKPGHYMVWHPRYEFILINCKKRMYRTVIQNNTTWKERELRIRIPVLYSKGGVAARTCIRRVYPSAPRSIELFNRAY